METLEYKIQSQIEIEKTADDYEIASQNTTK